MYDLISVGKNAVRASALLKSVPAQQRSRAVWKMAEAVRENSIAILEANRTDTEIARRSGCRTSKLMSLTLTGVQIGEIADKIEHISTLLPPEGTESETLLPDGSLVQEIRMPVGAVALVSEASPGMTAVLAAMCIMSANVMAVSGGQSAYGTNRAVMNVLSAALRSEGIPENSIQNVDDVSDETTRRFITLDKYFDLLIPVGDTAFIEKIIPKATAALLVPSFGRHHIYIDASAKKEAAVRLCCEGADTLLVHRDAASFLPEIKDELIKNGISAAGCNEAARLMRIPKADDDDWSDDGCRGTVLVRIVSSLEEALSHIYENSGHSADGIVASDDKIIRGFSERADSAVICINAPITTEADAVGISARKTARGPITLKSLTYLKRIVIG